MRLLPLLAVAVSPFALNSCTKGEPVPKIVKSELVDVGNGEGQVKGIINNPSKHPMKDIKLRFMVWGRLKGKNDPQYGSITSRTGGEAVAEINYLPPGAMVEFIAIGAEEPVRFFRDEPDPLIPEITAKWSD